MGKYNSNQPMPFIWGVENKCKHIIMAIIYKGVTFRPHSLKYGSPLVLEEVTLLQN